MSIHCTRVAVAVSKAQKAAKAEDMFSGLIKQQVLKILDKDKCQTNSVWTLTTEIKLLEVQGISFVTPPCCINAHTQSYVQQ